MNTSVVGSGSDSGSSILVDHIEGVLQYLPDNPLCKPTEQWWNYMLDNYTKWQISTWGNFIFHEVNKLIIYFIYILYIVEYNMIYIGLHTRLIPSVSHLSVSLRQMHIYLYICIFIFTILPQLMN